MFEGIKAETVNDATRWLVAHGYHFRGDFRVRISTGGEFDLREVLADFADSYFAEMQARVKAWQKIAEDAVNSKPTTIVRENANAKTS